MFRRLGDGRNTHIQICGQKINTIYKSLVAKHLELNEKSFANKVNQTGRKAFFYELYETIKN